MKALAAIVLLIGLAACASWEPDARRGNGWDKANRWYNPHWPRWAKMAYWLGPGH